MQFIANCLARPSSSSSKTSSDQFNESSAIFLLETGEIVSSTFLMTGAFGSLLFSIVGRTGTAATGFSTGFCGLSGVTSFGCVFLGNALFAVAWVTTGGLTTGRITGFFFPNYCLLHQQPEVKKPVNVTLAFQNPAPDREKYPGLYGPVK